MHVSLLSPAAWDLPGAEYALENTLSCSLEAAIEVSYISTSPTHMGESELDVSVRPRSPRAIGAEGI